MSPAREMRKRPEDRENPEERAIDHDKVERFGLWWDRFAPFLKSVLLVAGGWFVANIWIPLQKIPELVRHQETFIINDSVSATQRTMLIEKTDNLTKAVSILTKLQCLQTSAVDRAKIDLDCRDVPLPERQ
jgi:hypothetical protein